MHDRYTLQPAWTPVMAITFEGTYEAGPTPEVPNTPADYRRLGAEMAAAVVDAVRDYPAGELRGTRPALPESGNPGIHPRVSP